MGPSERDILRPTSLKGLVRNARLHPTKDIRPLDSHGRRKLVYKTKVLRDGRLEARRKEVKTQTRFSAPRTAVMNFPAPTGFMKKLTEPIIEVTNLDSVFR